MLCRPASRIRKQNGVHCQMSSSATADRADQTPDIQDTLTPNRASRLTLIGPLSA